MATLDAVASRLKGRAAVELTAGKYIEVDSDAVDEISQRYGYRESRGSTRILVWRLCLKRQPAAVRT